MTNLRTRKAWRKWTALAAIVAAIVFGVSPGSTVSAGEESSYAPVRLSEGFAKVMARMQAAKPEVMKRQSDLLAERYDLTDRPAKGVTMSGGKKIQEGVRVKLPAGMTWG